MRFRHAIARDIATGRLTAALKLCIPEIKAIFRVNTPSVFKNFKTSDRAIPMNALAERRKT